MANWLSILVRVAGAQFAAPLVQLQSELDARALERRVSRIEDPISAMHPDIRLLAGELYRAIQLRQRSHIDLEGEQYAKFARPLLLLEGAGYISGAHTFGGRFFGGLTISPMLMLYLAALEESPEAMTAVLERVDSAPPGRWLDGGVLASDTGVPNPVIRAVFDVFAARGLGMVSQEVGRDLYYARG